MKSVILCEGKDDVWFIAYYLYKTAGWDKCDLPWKNYNIVPLNRKQEVIHLAKESDSVAIWCVGGKDSFEKSISTIFEKFIQTFPFDPIDALVIVRDRDNDTIDDALSQIQKWFPNIELEVENKKVSPWNKEIDGYDVSLKIVPIVIPFSEEGAIETLLMASVREQGPEGEIVVQDAKKYIECLLEKPEIGVNYLSHERLILKAKYAAVIAVTNPGHSTGLFQDMVMACPWEKSKYVKEHFDVILKAISSN